MAVMAIYTSRKSYGAQGLRSSGVGWMLGRDRPDRRNRHYLSNAPYADGAPMGMKVNILHPSPPSSPQRGEESFSMDPSPPCGGEGVGEGGFRNYAVRFRQ